MKSENELTFKSLFLPLTTKKAIIFIFIIGFAVFFNSLFNPFQLDDYAQILNNPLVGNVRNIPSFFSSSIVHSGISTTGFLNIYYKPLMFTVFVMVHSALGNSPFYLHLLQLLLHLVNTLLVFIILARFLKKEISFILSLIFLIHPINAEPVIYIASMQDVLFIFFGLLAFSILMNNKNPVMSYSRAFFSAILILLSLFSKETGILFIGIISLYILLFDRANLKRVMTIVVASLLIYFSFRIIASHNSSSIGMFNSLIQQASLMTRLITIPKIIFYYFFKLLIPVNFAVAQGWVVKQIDLGSFFIPLFLDILIFIGIFTCGSFLYKRKANLLKTYAFFACWLCVGLIMHLQLIPLDSTVADRWFYFPMIGLLGMIGLSINPYYEQIRKNILMRNVAILLSCITFISLFSLTVIRNAQWQTRFTLLNHDVKFAQSPALDSHYGGMLLLKGQTGEAKYYLEKSVSQEPQLGYNLNNLAVFYVRKKNYTKAKMLYLKSIQLSNQNPNIYIYASYIGLAYIALNESNPQEARRMAQNAIKIAPLNTQANEYLAISQYQLGEKEAALSTIRKLSGMNANGDAAQLYALIKTNKPLIVSPSSGTIIIY
jgi:protein O-mannosyl-transferase